MRRFALDILVVLLSVGSCATYDEPERLAFGSPDGTISPVGGGGATPGPGAAGTPSGGSGAGSGGKSSEPGPSAGALSSSGTGSVGTSGGGAPAGGAGQGGAAPSDTCPDDPSKTAPGSCGCGFPDADTAKLASCLGLKSALLHRYDFEGSGDAVLDRVGEANGSLEGGAVLSQLAGKGVVVLGGGAAGPYVDLPNGLLSSLTSATLEVWVTWGGGTAWQRIFDFGDSSATAPENMPGTGKSYLFLTPATDTASGAAVRAVYSLDGGAADVETRVIGMAALPQVLTQAVVVVDAPGGTLSLYVDGSKVGEEPFTGSLAAINDVNAWLGRSQYASDPELAGTLHDFRIYGAALSPLQIATSFAAGADPAFLAE